MIITEEFKEAITVGKKLGTLHFEVTGKVLLTKHVLAFKTTCFPELAFQPLRGQPPFKAIKNVHQFVRGVETRGRGPSRHHANQVPTVPCLPPPLSWEKPWGAWQPLR